MTAYYRVLSRLVFCICIFASTIYAHSYRRQELRQVFSVNNVSLSPSLANDKTPQNLEVSFALGDEDSRFHLLLERNEDLYSQKVIVKKLRRDGTVHSAQTIPAGSHGAYRGTVAVSQADQDIPPRTVGWARVAVQVKDGVELFEGVFSIDDSEYHVQTDKTFRASWRPGEPEVPEKGEPYVLVWKYIHQGEEGSILKRQEPLPGTCGAQELEANQAWMHSGSLGASLETRQEQSLISSIGSTTGCPNTPGIALVGIATDCTYTQQFSSDDDLRQNVITQINSASRVYEQSFNVSLRVSNITISDSECPTDPDSTSTPWNRPCAGSQNLGDRLSLFSTWKAGFDDNTAVWSLLTACNSGSTVGIAWIGTVCRPGSLVRGMTRSNPSANVVARTESEWQVMSHEMGHNFGAVHDCTSSTCGQNPPVDCCPFSSGSCSANGQFIMNPSVNPRISAFSPCTIGQVCSLMGRNAIRTECLSGNEDVPTISAQLCGNGVVDEGEDCDCGGEEGCGDNACCDPKTCRFTSGSTCDPSTQGCCTDQCQPASSGKVCRASVGLCDPAESCDGNSPDCPENEKLPDGQSCGSDGGGLSCASGRCTSRSMQCSNLFTTSNSTANVSAEACSSDGCQLNCIQLDNNDNTCQATQQFFLDGTPCGNSGMCYSGSCSGANNPSSVDRWIDNHRTVFIVICVVGVILVLVILASLCCCLARRSRRKTQQRQMATWLQHEGQRRASMAPPGPGQGPPVFRQSSIQQQSWQQPMQGTGRVASPPPLVPRSSNLHRYA